MLLLTTTEFHPRSMSCWRLARSMLSTTSRRVSTPRLKTSKIKWPSQRWQEKAISLTLLAISVPVRNLRWLYPGRLSLGQWQGTPINSYRWRQPTRCFVETNFSTWRRSHVWIKGADLLTKIYRSKHQLPCPIVPPPSLYHVLVYTLTVVSSDGNGLENGSFNINNWDPNNAASSTFPSGSSEEYTFGRRKYRGN